LFVTDFPPHHGVMLVEDVRGKVNGTDMRALTLVFPTLSSHAEVHPAKIWNQPDQPDEEAISVESFPGLITSFPGHNRSPHRVDQHEPEGTLSGKGVWLPQVERSVCHAVHGQCAASIEQEADPERSHMPLLQIAGDPFGPHTHRVEDQSERDQGC
jgi:hypothetical protein